MRLEVRRANYQQDVRGERDWPLPGTQPRRLYLDATFEVRFDRDTELSGGMRLRVWVAAEAADDADLFVGVEKVDTTGVPVLAEIEILPSSTLRLLRGDAGGRALARA